VGEGGDFPRFTFALSGVREDFAKSAREITDGKQLPGEPATDVAAYFFGGGAWASFLS